MIGVAAAVPLLAAVAVRRMHPPERAWHAALGTVAVTGALVAAATAQVTFGALHGSDFVPGLGVDALSAPLLPLVAVLGAALVAARPAGARDRAELAALLATESALLALFASVHLDWLLLAWIATFAVSRADQPDAGTRRAERWVAIVSTAPLALAWALLAATGAPRDLATLAAHPPEGSLRTVVWALVVLASLLRLGVVPFQSLKLAALTRSGLGLPLLLVAARPGAFLLLRVAAPLTPEGAPLGLLADLGAVTALWGGVYGLAQTDPRRAIGAIAVSQAGILVAGIFAGTDAGFIGAHVQWLAVGLALLGLALVVEGLESRLGRPRVLAARGLATRLPGLATAFLVFALAAVGFPGTLGWVGEDLVVRGTLGHAPARAVALLTATAFNGIMLMRTFHHLFLGPAPRDLPWPAPLVGRERAVLVPLLLVLAALGLFPQRLLDASEPGAAAAELTGRP